MADFRLGNLVWKITGDTKDFDKGIKKADTSTSKFGKGLSKIGIAVAAAFAVKKVVEFGAKLARVASDFEESQNAVNVVFRESAGIIEEFGNNSIKSVGLAQTAYNELAVSTGALLKNAGLPLDEVADKTNELIQRSADLASVFNTDVQTASLAVGAALRGETEPARKFGITLNDAAVQAKALEAGLVDSKKEITEQVKIQARYLLILEQSNQVQGDFANTQESFANQSKIASQNIVELQRALGDALLPVASKLLLKGINPLLESFTKWISDTVTVTRANENLTKSFAELTEATEIQLQIDAARIALEKLNKEQEEYNEIIRESEEERQAWLDIGLSEAEVNAKVSSTLKVWGAEVARVEAEKAKLNQRVEDGLARLEDFKGGAEATIPTVKSLTAEFEKAAELVEKNSVSLDTMTKSHFAQAAQFYASRDAAAEYNQVIEDSRNIFEEWGISAQDVAANTFGALGQLYSSLGNLQQAQTNARLADIDRQLQAELEAQGLAEETTIERLRREVEEANLAGDTALASEKKRELQREQLIEKAERKRRQVEYQSALASWGIQLASATATGAQAIINGFATQPFIPAGLAAGGLATTLTALQLGAISAAKPQRPNFATGGIMPQQPGVSTVGDNHLANVNPGEMVLTRGQQQNLFNTINSGLSSGGRGITINQYNNLNTDTIESLEKAAQILYPALEAEGVRRG
jgi:hypothetical protein